MIGFYAGSFDPFTNGHLHVLKTASRLFDKVIVGLGDNGDKRRRFDKNAMLSAIKEVVRQEGLDNVECITYSGLLVDVAKENNADFLVRGVRNGVDYSYEENLAEINEELSGVQTIYVRAGKLGVISSSMVYELYKAGKDFSRYLPTAILDILVK